MYGKTLNNVKMRHEENSFDNIRIVVQKLCNEIIIWQPIHIARSISREYTYFEAFT